MSLYYKMMVSCIYTAQKSSVLHDIWKFSSLLYFSAAMCCNILFIILLIKENFYEALFSKIYVYYVFDSKLNFLINLFLHLLLPIFLFNYVMVFYNNDYRDLIEKYHSNYNKKLFVVYFIFSLVLIIFYLFSLVEIRWT